MSDSPILDDAGNRTAGQTSLAGDRLISDGTYQYQYDKEGNVIFRWTGNPSQPVTRYVWDNRNRLIEVGDYANASTTAATQRVVMRYSDDDQLIRKSVIVGNNTTTERYAYEGSKRILETTDAGAVTHRYHFGAEQAGLLADEAFGAPGNSATVLWALNDHIGTVRDVVNALGEIVNHLDYDEHGKIIRVVNGSEQSVFISERAIDVAFAGREFVDEIGLANHQARWYSPSLERFISEDPIAADSNLYRYANNDPINLVDPTGRSFETPTTSLAALKPSKGVPNHVFMEMLTGIKELPEVGDQDFYGGVDGFSRGKVVKIESIGYGKALGDGIYGDNWARGSEAMTKNLSHLVLNAFAPAVKQSHLITYENGSTEYRLNGTPSPSGMFNQAMLIGSLMPGPKDPKIPAPRPQVSVPRTTVSSDTLATPNRLQNKLAAWQRYEGDLNLKQWSKSYDQLQINRARSKWAESFDEPGARYSTPYGIRIVDNAPAIEVKTGYQSMTKFIRRQIIKDSYLQRTIEGYNPRWRFIDQVPSKPLLNKLDTFGIPYELPVR